MLYNANDYKQKHNPSRGFTIVELLIVIVVIAILAAITAIAYTGIQDRAYISRAASIVDSYIKVIEMYRVDHGEYPFEGQDYEACLGRVSDYPAEGNFAAGQCRTSSIPGTQDFTVDNALNDLLRPYVSEIPSGELPVLTMNPGEIWGGEWIATRGAYYASNFAESPEGPPTPGLIFAIKGNQNCPRGVKSYIEELNSTSCLVYLKDPS